MCSSQPGVPGLIHVTTAGLKQKASDLWLLTCDSLARAGLRAHMPFERADLAGGMCLVDLHNNTRPLESCSLCVDEPHAL